MAASVSNLCYIIAQHLYDGLSMVICNVFYRESVGSFSYSYLICSLFT